MGIDEIKGTWNFWVIWWQFILFVELLLLEISRNISMSEQSDNSLLFIETKLFIPFRSYMVDKFYPLISLNKGKSS